MLRASLERATELTKKWMDENPNVPDSWRTDFGALVHANRGVACFESLIACLFAAAETGREQYSGQLGWVRDEIRRIPTWPQGGYVYWVDFRDTVLFFTQALIGGKLECGEGKTAYNLAITKVQDRYLPAARGHRDRRRVCRRRFSLADSGKDQIVIVSALATLLLQSCSQPVAYIWSRFSGVTFEQATQNRQSNTPRMPGRGT